MLLLLHGHIPRLPVVGSVTDYAESEYAQAPHKHKARAARPCSDPFSLVLVALLLFSSAFSFLLGQPGLTDPTTPQDP